MTGRNIPFKRTYPCRIDWSDYICIVFIYLKCYQQLKTWKKLTSVLWYEADAMLQPLKLKRKRSELLALQLCWNEKSQPSQPLPFITKNTAFRLSWEIFFQKTAWHNFWQRWTRLWKKKHSGKKKKKNTRRISRLQQKQAFTMRFNTTSTLCESFLLLSRRAQLAKSRLPSKTIKKTKNKEACKKLI